MPNKIIVRKTVDNVEAGGDFLASPTADSTYRRTGNPYNADYSTNRGGMSPTSMASGAGSAPSLDSNGYPIDRDDGRAGKTKWYDAPRQWWKSLTARGPRVWIPVVCCMILVLVGLILLIIYLSIWKGMPTVTVIGVVPPDEGGKNSLKVDLGAGGVRPPSFTMRLDLKVKMYNPNLIDLMFETINVELFSAAKQDLLLGQAEVSEFLLPRESEKELILNINVYYIMSTDPEGLIPADLVWSCTKPEGQAQPGKLLELNVTTSALVRVTKEIKVRNGPNKENTNLVCPFQGPQILTVAGIKVDLTKVDWPALGRGEFALKDSLGSLNSELKNKATDVRNQLENTASNSVANALGPPAPAPVPVPQPAPVPVVPVPVPAPQPAGPPVDEVPSPPSPTAVSTVASASTPQAASTSAKPTSAASTPTVGTTPASSKSATPTP